MSAEEPHSRPERETEIDFREFFSSEEYIAVRRLDSAPAETNLGDTVPHRGEIKPASTRPLMSWPTGTNIIFATITFVGGLFYIFHVFSTAEPFRAIAVWPSEILYQRPFAPDHLAPIDVFSFPTGYNSRSAAPDVTDKSASVIKKTDPI